jgi:hypothetical protein
VKIDGRLQRLPFSIKCPICLEPTTAMVLIHKRRARCVACAVRINVPIQARQPQQHASGAALAPAVTVITAAMAALCILPALRLGDIGFLVLLGFAIIAVWFAVGIVKGITTVRRIVLRWLAEKPATAKPVIVVKNTTHVPLPLRKAPRLIEGTTAWSVQPRICKGCLKERSIFTADEGLCLKCSSVKTA